MASGWKKVRLPFIAGMLTASVLAGCHTALTPLTGPLGSTVASLAQAAQDPVFNRETYLTLSANVLADAMTTGEAETVQAFVTHADGADPEPDGSKIMAQRALDKVGKSTLSISQAMHDNVVRIAAGNATPLPVQRQTAIQFPRDEGNHRFAITEWWYVNGHLNAGGAPRYGYEFTLFKVGPLLHFAHVAVTEKGQNRFHYERRWIPVRSASSSSQGLDVRFDDLRLSAEGNGQYRLVGHAQDATLDLLLQTRKQPLLINGNGKIDMPEGKDSWYYSQTRLTATGAVGVGGAVEHVDGFSWIDHQWGPFYVSGLRARWDWFSLQCDDGTEYNLFGFRNADGSPVARYVNVSQKDGRNTAGGSFTMGRDKWWQSPLTKLNYVTDWHIALPNTNDSFDLTATNQNQELPRQVSFFKDPLPQYWEGSMQVTKHGADGHTYPGVGYCEHFGFAQPVGPSR